MAGWIEQRILVLEQRLEKLSRDVTSLLPLLRAAQQQLNQQGAIPQQGGGGATVYFANNLSLAGATGTWPTITPSSTTADVYKEVSGALALVAAAATIYNFLPDATDPANRQVLGSNGDGSWSVQDESCSAG